MHVTSCSIVRVRLWRKPRVLVYPSPLPPPRSHPSFTHSSSIASKSPRSHIFTTYRSIGVFNSIFRFNFSFPLDVTSLHFTSFNFYPFTAFNSVHSHFISSALPYPTLHPSQFHYSNATNSTYPAKRAIRILLYPQKERGIIFPNRRNH